MIRRRRGGGKINLWTGGVSGVKSQLVFSQFNQQKNNPMELKVVCYCGQKYKFDVQPIDGRMPFTVNCPVCNVDGTPLANQLLREQISPSVPASAPVVTAPLIAPLPTPAPAAPAPVAAASAIVPPSSRATGPTLQREPAPATGGSGVRIKTSVAAPPPLPVTATAPPPIPATASSAVAKPAAAVKPLMNKPLDSPKDFNMGRGILGAFLGAAVGGGLVYGFFMLSGFRFPLSGTAIGILAGLGARWLARGTDSTLGAISAALALATIVGVFYLMYGEFYLGGIISMAVCVYFAYRFAA